MVTVKIKGLKEYFEPKSGKFYRYHRKSGTRILSAPGTPEFSDEIRAAEAKLAKKPAGGTLGHVIDEYRASPAFMTLKPRTRADYEKVMLWLKPLHGAAFSEIGRAQIAQIRDRAFAAHKRSFANYVLAVFSILFSFAIERELAETNPVAKVKKVRRATDARKVNRPWTLTEREAVYAAAPAHLLLPIAIGRWTGMREGDVLRMAKTAYDGKTIRVVTGKRGVPIAVPAAAPLQATIDAALLAAAAPDKSGQTRPQTIALCANSRGKPWTGSGFRSSFFKLIRKLEDTGAIGQGLTFHGLRHTVATELRELGYDSRTIADMLGQKTQAQADHYSAEADLEMKMRGVVQKMERANSKRTKVSRKRDESV